jgi:cell shape-determining protein MreC
MKINNPRYCIKCRADISFRSKSAKYCKPCQRQNQKEIIKNHKLESYYNQAKKKNKYLKKENKRLRKLLNKIYRKYPKTRKVKLNVIKGRRDNR